MAFRCRIELMRQQAQSSFIRFVPKKLAAVLFIVIGISVPVAGFAWGPTRDSFTEASLPTQVALNAVTDNSEYGDERDFMKASLAGTSNFQNDVAVEPGKEYWVQLYVRNAAKEAVAKNVQTYVNIPRSAGDSLLLKGFVSAANAKPKSVWDQVTFTSTNNVKLSYVAGSATLGNNSTASNSLKLADVNKKPGAKLGYKTLDGSMMAGQQYAGYVRFTVKVAAAETSTQSSLSLVHEVRAEGDDSWSSSVEASGGDVIEHRLSYKNTGGTQQVPVATTILPDNLQYIEGSSTITNDGHKNGVKVKDQISEDGKALGHYEAGLTAALQFQTTYSSADSCEKAEASSTVTAGTIKATAKATIAPSDNCDQTTDTTSSDDTDTDTTVTSSTDSTSTSDSSDNLATADDNATSTTSRRRTTTTSSTNQDQPTTQNEVVVADQDSVQTTDPAAVDSSDEFSTDETAATEDSDLVAEKTTDKQTVTTLPSNGIESVFGSAVGIGSVGYGTHLWLSSRRSLRSAALQIFKRQ